MEFTLVDALTLLSILLVSVTWYITHRKSKHDLKTHNTVTLISNLSVVEHLRDADILVREKITNNEVFPALIPNPGVEKCLITILDYYEFLSRLFLKDSIDRRAIVELRGTLMLETLKVSSDYITESARKTKREDLYSAFSEVCAIIAGERQ
ncbi:MAG: hypothetical protein R3332_03155 [Pseudohongiellaceae bacterium]|nr:hypothetical protein [Pseudohongiellaceae bacterium]